MEGENITLLDGEVFEQLKDFPDYYVSNCGRRNTKRENRILYSKFDKWTKA